MSREFVPLSEVERRLDPEVWYERVAAADAEAETLSEVLTRVRAGESRRSTFAVIVPERPHRTMLTELRRFEGGRRDARIDLRAPEALERKTTAEVRGAVGALAHAHPELGSEALVVVL